MTAFWMSLIAAVCIFAATLLGLLLRRYLPEPHLSEQAKDTVKLGVGMIATLSALVLGLLVNSAKNSFDTINSGFVQSGARLVQLDEVLDQFGSESAPVRQGLRQVVEDGLVMLWPEEYPGKPRISQKQHISTIVTVQQQLRSLKPQTESQRDLLVKAEELASELTRTRWLIVEQSQGPLPPLLLAVVIFWLSMLYLSFGLFAPRNATVITILFLCAMAVSLAIFVTMEMNRPLSGIVKVSSTPLRAALESLGK